MSCSSFFQWTLCQEIYGEWSQQGSGVVVLTNSETGLPVAYDIAGKALGGKANWKSF